MTRLALAASVAHLKHRALAMNVAPMSWTDVTADLARLRVGAGYAAASTAALAVDGTATAFEDQWPDEVVQALEHLGLSERWDPTSLHRTVGWINEKQQLGLVNDLKGTILEQEAVRLADSGELPLPNGADGLRLAEDLRQPGWDAELVSGDEVVGYVQMKATANLEIIREHLERYPEYSDVMTTTEAATKAAAHGIGVIDTGVLDADLSALAEGAVDSLDLTSALHEVLPGSAAAVILVMAALRIRQGQQPAQAARWARNELGTAGVAHLAGLTVEVATGTALLRPVTSVLTRLTARRMTAGRAARQDMALLRARLATLHPAGPATVPA